MPKHKRHLCRLALMVLVLCDLGAAQNQPVPSPDVITIDANAPSHPLPHFWEEMFGSGRAILSLRDNYRQDLRDVKKITGFEYVRFHAIFHDEIGVYQEDDRGHAVYNFSYVDQIYDGLLANGVKPFVELSFMPNQLAARPAMHAFWYKPNVSPPKDYAKWDDLIAAFTTHLIERYGLNEVASWYFEVWNEPNIDFWTGEPKQATYWELYDHTARAIKRVNSRLRVGGPATAQAAWIDVFIRHCVANKVPLDFVSTHVYGNDKSEDVFGTSEQIPREQMVCRAVKKVHEQIKSSALPALPLVWSEFNASYKNEPEVTDSVYMGPWLADTIRQCDGLVDVMSYWTFSDVFEEQGVVKTPFYGGFGLIAVDDVPKPSYVGFQLLHKLGDQRIDLSSSTALLTRRSDGTLVLALWNYKTVGQADTPRIITLHFKDAGIHEAALWRLDAEHGDVHKVYKELGEPRYPTRSQIQQLRAASELQPPENVEVRNQTLTLPVPGDGLLLVELK